MGDLTDDRRPPISGETRLAAVIGMPVRHSLSPTLLNAAFVEAGLDWHFMALEVAEGQSGEALDAVRALGLAGLSVTCLLYTSPSPRDKRQSRMPSSA